MKKVFSIYMSVFLLGIILTACGGDGGESSQPVPSSVSWTIQHGTVSDDLARGIAVDSSGNIYVAGYTLGNLEGSNVGYSDLFVVKYNADGTKQWTQQLGTTSVDSAMGIAVAGSNIYLTGYTNGSLVGTDSNQGGDDFFVVKLTQADGAIVWTQQLGTTADDWAIGIAVDGSYIYVTGFTYGDLDGINQGDADLFVVKLVEENGTPVWIKQLGTTATEYANGIALDISGNIYVTGYTEGNLVGTKQGGKDLFVVKLTQGQSGAPTVLWTEQLGTASDDVATGIALDSGNIYVTGLTTGYLGDTGSKVGTTDADLFVVKLTQDIAGNPTVAWKTQLGSTDEDWANGIALDNSGYIYVTGFTFGVLDGTNQGGTDLFVVKLTQATGGQVWTRQLGTVENDWGMGIALDSSGGKIYATGGTCGNLDGNTSAGCSDFFVVKYAADGTKQ